MPELPEVETIRRALEPAVTGRVIRKVIALTERLRSPVEKKKLNKELKGREILAVKRRAKYLLFVLNGEKYLLAHLGMTGAYRVEETGFEFRKHDRVVFELDGGESLVYNDIRKFGEVKLVEVSAGKEFPDRFDSYAPEPLSSEFDGKYLFGRLQRVTSAVKVAIMRQELVVGVGNIYASEALFAAKISPLRRADSLSLSECRRLVKEIRKVLNASLKSGGTTISDYRQPDGSEGKFALSLKVYGRAEERCRRRGCDGTVCRIVQTGRSTFYCPECQY